jgi:hypothetical protein
MTLQQLQEEARKLFYKEYKIKATPSDYIHEGLDSSQQFSHLQEFVNKVITQTAEVARAEAYDKGYINGLSHAKDIIRKFAEQKETRFVFGEKSLPIGIEGTSFMRTLAHNLVIHFEQVIKHVQSKALEDSKEL